MTRIKLYQNISELEDMQFIELGLYRGRDIDAVVGRAILDKIIIDNLSVFYLEDLKTFERGRGYSSLLLEAINSKIRENDGSIGFLVDGIMPDNPAKGVYQRHGWAPISDDPEENYMFYNYEGRPEDKQDLASKIVSFVEKDIYCL
jgi:hypothetical protein